VGTPAVSAIVLTRYPERAEMLEAALASFEAQTLADAEVVIVNDGAPVACDLARAHVVNLPPGPARTIGEKRNRGLEIARGEWVATWDDDDVSLPVRLEEALAATEGGRFEYVKSRTMWVADHDLRIAALHHGWCLPTALVRRSAALALGGFPAVSYAEDHMLFEALWRAGRPNAPGFEWRSYVHRRHGGNVSALATGQSLGSHAAYAIETTALERARVQSVVDGFVWRPGKPRAVRPLGSAAPPPPPPAGVDLRRISPLESLALRMRRGGDDGERRT
jgi:hypothetical protein